ncbi:hypothetical protein Ahy_A05g021952 isoform C [Arachis hypogaea]|uniref:Uncharacterized protein n=1 Tax=Arachis hypogaea TaxID=3818 RepID=A0A445CZ42_ARAHY|nr:hypothetical protein Ahy_A05g021952 isoform C [Arachis hypogaea]
MASASLLLTLSTLSLLLSPSFSDSRKELREKEGLLLLKKENASSHYMLGLGHSVNPNGIDPTRVVQISWQPRSGTFYSLQLFLHLKHCHFFMP